jgi:hypothetical protein
MSRFRCHPIRERDADGHLVAAGVEWAEERDIALAGFWVVGCILGPIGACALMFHVVDKGGLVFGLVCLGLLACLIVCARRLPGRTRALVFHEDGSTSAPYGFAHAPRSHRRITIHNADFVSIEAQGHPAMCDVVLFTRCGETVYVAGWLHRDSAHKVAVQLTLALAELRESAGERRQGGAGLVAPPQGLAETLID